MLGLAYLWVGSVNGVQLQVWATWLYYAIPVDLCDDVAQALQVPLDRISVEMVARGLYHYVQATANGYNDSAMRYFAEHAKLLGILKCPKEPGGPSVLTQVSLAPQPDLARRPGTAWAPNCRSWQRRPRPIVAAHLGWEVTKLPLYAGEDDRLHRVREHFAVVRKDTWGQDDAPVFGTACSASRHPGLAESGALRPIQLPAR